MAEGGNSKFLYESVIRGFYVFMGLEKDTGALPFLFKVVLIVSACFVVALFLAFYNIRSQEESTDIELKMNFFSKDPKQVGKIAASLQQCGCCARCTLRYLGLKDSYAYRKSIQEMKATLERLLEAGDSKAVTDTETQNVEADKIDNEELTAEKISRDMLDSTSNQGSVTNGSGIIHQIGSENTADLTKVNFESSNAFGCDTHIGKLETVENEGIMGKTDELETGLDRNNIGLPLSAERETDINKSKVGKSGGAETKQDEPKEKQMHVGLTQSDTLLTNEMEIDHKTETRNSLPVLKEERNRTDQSSEEETNCQKPCIVCLGILEEFTTEEFLHKIKAASVDEGFEFSNYICSLMIPVSIILREHALLLFLKEAHESVYEKIKFLDIPTIKDVWKWRNGPELRNILGAPFDQKSTFDIILTFVYKDSDKECSFLLSLMSDTFRKRKQDRRHNKKKGAFQLYNRANVTKAVLEMSTKEFKSHFQCPPKVPNMRCTCDIKCQNEAIFIAGRYNKYSRTLSQTPWLIEGKRKSESSVEELICTEIDKAFKPTEHKFSSAGREDVDVLMLGDGRPFIVELTNPCRVNFTQEDITNMQTMANNATKDIHIRDLQIVTREETEKLKEGEIDKIKNYISLCWSKTPLSVEELNKLTEMKDLKIYQKTPIRVLHRRPLSTREKCIHSMTVEKVDDYHFRLGLKTQAGTYIKEFVHGDFGRTKPNLTDLLGVDCDILELDVQSVELDWPEKLL